ncbi:MAG: DUF692 domain-containing protein [Candidatus Berkiellales bacterium]
MSSKKTSNHSSPNDFTYLGFGLGLRTDHYADILEHKPKVDWFEILTENYLVPGGKPLYYLDKIRAHYPMVMHGVSMSIGSMDPLNWDYLSQVKALADRIQTKWLSDHLCWTSIHNTNSHDLLPLPYTEEALDYVIKRVSQVQDYLGRQILIENPSSYLTFTHSDLTEWEFLRHLAEQADCYLLLDVNNIYVSAFNHGFDPLDYLAGIPGNRVKQIHLAGHSNNGDHIIDTHDATIIDPVWALYAKTIEKFGPISTMIERDDKIPPLNELLEELSIAKQISEDITKELNAAG